MRGNGSIVSCCPCEYFSSQPAAQFKRGIPRLFDLLGHGFIISRIHHYGDALMVLRGAAQHGWSADIYIFDGLLDRDIEPGDCLLEGIKVYHYQVDWWNALQS